MIKTRHLHPFSHPNTRCSCESLSSSSLKSRTMVESQCRSSLPCLLTTSQWVRPLGQAPRKCCRQPRHDFHSCFSFQGIFLFVPALSLSCRYALLFIPFILIAFSFPLSGDRSNVLDMYSLIFVCVVDYVPYRVQYFNVHKSNWVVPSFLFLMQFVTSLPVGLCTSDVFLPSAAEYYIMCCHHVYSILPPEMDT